MKNKWTVLVIIALLGLILGLQYASKKHEAKLAGQGALAGPGEPAGVGLPPDAVGYGQDPGALAFPAMTGAEASVGVCEGGSFNDIVVSHGKIWGYSARQGPVFAPAETEKMYAAMGNYSSCKAVATGNIAECDYLPAVGFPEGKGKGSRQYTNARYKCTDGVNRVLFHAYMAGKYKNISACKAFLSGDAVRGANLDSAEFCPLAAEGMENICAGLASSLPASKKADCLKSFPGKDNDCHGDKFCLDWYNLYLAIKAGNPNQCPEGNRASCEAFLSKNQAPCSSLAVQASELYCSYLAKREAGPAAAFKAEKEKKDAERLSEQQKKEQEKISREMNKKIRKMLGRE